MLNVWHGVRDGSGSVFRYVVDGPQARNGVLGNTIGILSAVRNLLVVIILVFGLVRIVERIIGYLSVVLAS